MTPLQQLQKLMDDKVTDYFWSGLSSSVKGRFYVNILRRKDQKIIQGYGETLDNALLSAMSRLQHSERPVGRPVLPGLTRPVLPGMTR